MAVQTQLSGSLRPKRISHRHHPLQMNKITYHQATEEEYMIILEYLIEQGIAIFQSGLKKRMSFFFNINNIQNAFNKRHLRVLLCPCSCNKVHVLGYCVLSIRESFMNKNIYHEATTEIEIFEILESWRAQGFGSLMYRQVEKEIRISPFMPTRISLQSIDKLSSLFWSKMKFKRAVGWKGRKVKILHRK